MIDYKKEKCIRGKFIDAQMNNRASESLRRRVEFLDKVCDLIESYFDVLLTEDSLYANKCEFQIRQYTEREKNKKWNADRKVKSDGNNKID